jgi:hypothetical protein
MNIVFVLFYVQYLPADGRKSPKHVGALLPSYLNLHLTAAHLLKSAVSNYHIPRNMGKYNILISPLL